MRLSRPHAGPHHQVRAERWTRLVRAASRRRGGHRRPRRVRRPRDGRVSVLHVGAHRGEHPPPFFPLLACKDLWRPFLRQVWSQMITDPQALVSPSEPPAFAGGRGLILDRSTSAFRFLWRLDRRRRGCGSGEQRGAVRPRLVACRLPRARGRRLPGRPRAGRLALRAPRPTPALLRAQLVLWNLGSLTVPAGVLVDAPTLVTVGSVALLWALALFAAGASGVRREVRVRAVVYLAIVVGLAASVVVGSALAGAVPGAWL
jgi:hypothetical protein